MRRALDLLYTASGAFAAVCLAGIAVLMLAQAVGREFGLLIRGSDDITAWLLEAHARDPSVMAALRAGWPEFGDARVFVPAPAMPVDLPRAD